MLKLMLNANVDEANDVVDDDVDDNNVDDSC